MHAEAALNLSSVLTAAPEKSGGGGGGSGPAPSAGTLAARRLYGDLRACLEADPSGRALAEARAALAQLLRQVLQPVIVGCCCCRRW